MYASKINVFKVKNAINSVYYIAACWLSAVTGTVKSICPSCCGRISTEGVNGHAMFTTGRCNNVN